MQNKITFIYDYKQGETWSTPMALVNEFKERGWETEIVSIANGDDSQLQLWIQQDTPTDIIMFLDWGRFDSKWLDKSLKPNSFWIQESGDDPQNFERNYPKANRFHYTITPDKQSAIEYRNRGINAEWINHFADTKVQFPTNSEPEYTAVTTRGLGNSQFLDYITNWGEGAIGNKNGMGAKEHTEFLNSGLMVIQNSRWQEITRRLFEGMACGKLVITDRLPENRGLDEVFAEGEEIILYNDMFDCIEKINYYAENEEERERIAHNGMIKVLHNYTQIQVVDKLINKFETSKMDTVFRNYPNVLKYFTPESYLDIGVCKGHAISFILQQLPSLKRVEMIEANKLHEEDLIKISNIYNIPYKIEVLSDIKKEVVFHLDGKGKDSTGPGNSYYLENSNHFIDTPSEIRITSTLDDIYSNNETFDLIKMDTQGSELDIIKGGINLIRNAKAIILEENVYTYNIGAPLHDEILSYMNSIGFELVELLDDKNQQYTDKIGNRINQREIDTLYIRKDLLTK